MLAIGLEIEELPPRSEASTTYIAMGDGGEAFWRAARKQLREKNQSTSSMQHGGSEWVGRYGCQSS
jgi:hypothetical protein